MITRGTPTSGNLHMSSSLAMMKFPIHGKSNWCSKPTTSFTTWWSMHLLDDLQFMSLTIWYINKVDDWWCISSKINISGCIPFAPTPKSKGCFPASINRCSPPVSSWRNFYTNGGAGKIIQEWWIHQTKEDTRWCPPSYKLVYNPNNYRYNPLMNPNDSTYKPT